MTRKVHLWKECMKALGATPGLYLIHLQVSCFLISPLNQAADVIHLNSFPPENMYYWSCVILF